MFPYGETVTRLRAPLVADPYSGQATRRDWTAAVALPIADCAVNPGQSSEAPTVNREATTTTPTLYAPYGADVLTADRIVSVTGTWDVDGHGAQWRSPFTGWTPGSTFPLRRVDG